MIDADNDVHVIDRANAWSALRDCDFERAVELFENIIFKEPENHEAYWGRALASAGIVYVTDLNENKRVPTCNNIREESFVDSNDVKRAIALAPEDIVGTYKKQAAEIEAIRVEWVRKASREKPYDVFICFKDSDREHNIERTDDSYDAHELYNALTEEGYKVFFSRVSLRDKVSEHYEPYIYNALKTAKVMIVFGEKAEYFNAVWVKNEWTRYRAMIERGEKDKNSLVAVYKNISPGDLPAGLRLRQCLDAGEMTFLEDLKRHISKVIKNRKAAEAPKKQNTVISGLHEHEYISEVIKPTCIAKGYTIHRCDCGYEYRDSYTPLVDHQFKIIDSAPPTCTTGGSEEKICEICGEKVTKELPALGHQFAKWVEVKHPTCAEDGEEQRQCTKCGETETRVMPKTYHNFGGWTITPDGKRIKYCNNCGVSQEDVHYNKHKNSHSEGDNESVIAFRDILRNFGLYHKQYFTKRTTPVQKIKHWLWYSLMLVCILMWVVSVMASYSDGTSGNSTNIETYWIWILLVNGILLMIAHSIASNEKKRYLAQELTYPPNVCSRPAMLVFSRFLLVFSSSGFAQISSIHQYEKIEGIFMGTILGVWAVITALYAHCPKEYKKIRFRSNSDASTRKIFSIAGVALSLLLTFSLGAVGGLSEDANKKNIIAEAEELYLSGNASEAAELLKEHGIEENYEAYSCVAKGEYTESGLKNIVVPNGTHSIEQNAFKNYELLQSVTIPNSVVSIGDHAFYYCINLESVVIPGSVTSIGDYAFYCCRSLTSIEIPDSVTSIGNYAFWDCSRLTSVTIGDSVTSIGEWAFSYCYNLTSIKYQGTKAQWKSISKGDIWNYNTGNYTIYCTDGEISK